MKQRNSRDSYDVSSITNQTELCVHGWVMESKRGLFLWIEGNFDSIRSHGAVH